MTDASLWVSRILPTDSQHRTATTWMADALATGVQFSAPWLLLVEVAGALSRRSGDPTRALEAVRLMLRTGSLRLLVPTRDLWSLATESAATLGIRGADALYVATAQQLGEPLVTLDLDQARRASAVVEVVRPVHVTDQ